MNKNGRQSFISRALARTLAPLALALSFATPAQAASVSYFLDQSNVFADGVNYLQVTIADGADGAIDFTVEALAPLLSIAGSNFGIQGFAFNVGSGSDATNLDVTNLPAGWRTRADFRMASFGVFDIKVNGGGASRLSSFSFSINGIEGDTPEDYLALSTRRAADGNQFFAAKVGGFLCQEGAKKCFSSGYFGGSTAVPLPAAAWLFLTGMAGVAIRARRRSTSRA